MEEVSLPCATLIEQSHAWHGQILIPTSIYIVYRCVTMFEGIKVYAYT